MVRLKNLLLVVLVLVSSNVLVAASRKHAVVSESISAPTTPCIEFSETSHDFGSLLVNEKTDFELTIKAQVEQMVMVQPQKLVFTKHQKTP